jgi:hypothetical protein
LDVYKIGKPVNSVPPGPSLLLFVAIIYPGVSQTNLSPSLTAASTREVAGIANKHRHT